MLFDSSIQTVGDCQQCLCFTNYVVCNFAIGLSGITVPCLTVAFSTSVMPSVMLYKSEHFISGLVAKLTDRPQQYWVVFCITIVAAS